MDHFAALERLMRDEPEIVYVFTVASNGKVLSEAGDRAALPHQGLVDTCLRPESIQAFDEELKRYRAKGPAFTPRICGQGRCFAAIDSPTPGLLVFAFGIEPENIASDEGVRWMRDFQKRIKSALGDFGDGPKGNCSPMSARAA